MRLFNKVAITTGAGSGIGRALAILFAEEGAKVVVVDINDVGGEETVSVVNETGGKLFLRTDVSIASEAEGLINATKKK